MKTLLLYLGLGAIASHELDAVRQHEWRLLYILRGLPEALAEQVFIAVHVPLFAVLIWLLHHPRNTLRAASRVLLMAFLVIHVGLHLRLSGHALYTFHAPLSVALIWLAGLAGLGYLALCLPRRR